jgi:hypothetical protein
MHPVLDICQSGGIGRRAGLKIQSGSHRVRVRVPPLVHTSQYLLRVAPGRLVICRRHMPRGLPLFLSRRRHPFLLHERDEALRWQEVSTRTRSTMEPLEFLPSFDPHVANLTLSVFRDRCLACSRKDHAPGTTRRTECAESMVGVTKKKPGHCCPGATVACTAMVTVNGSRCCPYSFP